MHGGDAGAVPGDAEEAHQPGVARLDRRAQRALGSHRQLPLVLLHEVVELEQVDGGDAQALEGAADLVARAGVAALAGLRREEEVGAVALHPGADAELGVAVGRGGVDVVDARGEELGERAVGLLLGHEREGRGAEEQRGCCAGRCGRRGGWGSWRHDSPTGEFLIPLAEQRSTLAPGGRDGVRFRLPAPRGSRSSRDTSAARRRPPASRAPSGSVLPGPTPRRTTSPRSATRTTSCSSKGTARVVRPGPARERRYRTRADGAPPPRPGALQRQRRRRVAQRLGRRSTRAPDWDFVHRQLILRAGFAWVGVSAQRVGIEGGGLAAISFPLKTREREALRRRSRIRATPSAFDIFSQVGRAAREGGLLGGLVPRDACSRSASPSRRCSS